MNRKDLLKKFSKMPFFTLVTAYNPLRMLHVYNKNGWESKFETTKCRMTDISEFQNCEYVVK